MATLPTSSGLRASWSVTIRVPDALTPKRVVEVVALVKGGTLSRQAARKVLAEMLVKPGPAADLAFALGLIQVQDAEQIDAWVREALEAHPGEAARYRAGEAKLLAFFVGQVMKRSRGKADPKAVNAALTAALGGA